MGVKQRTYWVVNSGRIRITQPTVTCLTSSPNSRHTVDTRVGVINSGHMGGVKQIKYLRVIKKRTYGVVNSGRIRITQPTPVSRHPTAGTLWSVDTRVGVINSGHMGVVNR